MFERILIANRGEIAVRIIRACRELGIATVAVYSDADRDALHVRLADQAIHVGESAPRDSYLNIGNIVDAARESGAKAIHPGYGFLAENAQFAQAVVDAGLVFIGPSPFSIGAMGDKAAARERMITSGVPVVPGYEGAEDENSLAQAAVQIGYPILIKAAAGGGGKGMRIARQPSELLELTQSVRREAHHAFGDSRVILEKYVQQARHIEFQVLADRHGNTVHMFERECSIQRRHQKIIEETPSPLLDDELRTRMGEAAVAAARSVNYENAGTVEFIVDPETREFYFLEMNTRLQVEHPITELTTGLDLVQWQIRIAQGKQFPYAQADLQPRGHALECRVYAEDPENDFLPATGKVLDYAEPTLPGIRADSGITQGSQITAFYDPLLVKLMAYSETRDGVIARMENALRDFVLLGVTTNIDFLQAVLAHPTFRAGRATTQFIEEHLSGWTPDDALPREALVVAAIAELERQSTNSPEISKLGGDPYSPWSVPSNFRLGDRGN